MADNTTTNLMTDEELRVWAIEQAIKTQQFQTVQNVIATAQQIFNYVRPPAVSAPSS
jgi:hypothetical protein